MNCPFCNVKSKLIKNGKNHYVCSKCKKKFQQTGAWLVYWIPPISLTLTFPLFDYFDSVIAGFFCVFFASIIAYYLCVKLFVKLEEINMQ